MKKIEELKNYNSACLVSMLTDNDNSFGAWEVLSNDYKKIANCKKYIIEMLSSKEFSIEEREEYGYTGPIITTLKAKGFGLEVKKSESKNNVNVIFPNGKGLGFFRFLMTDSYYEIDCFMKSIEEIDDSHMTSSHHLIKKKLISLCNEKKIEIKPKKEKIKEEKEELERRIKSLEDDIRFYKRESTEKYTVQHIKTVNNNYLVKIENCEFTHLLYISPEGRILRDASDYYVDDYQNEWEWAEEEWYEDIVNGFPEICLKESEIE